MLCPACSTDVIEHADGRVLCSCNETRDLEIQHGPFLEHHLNRNPRVFIFYGDNILTIVYNPRIKVSLAISAEALWLGLDALGCPPIAEGTTLPPKPVQHNPRTKSFQCECGEKLTFTIGSTKAQLLRNVQQPDPWLKFGHCPYCWRRHWMGRTWTKTRLTDN